MRLPLDRYCLEYHTKWSGQRECILGEGTYGTVSLVRNNSTGKLAACKRFKRRGNDQSAETEIWMADVLDGFPHRNVLAASAVVSQNDVHVMVVMPYCDESIALKFQRHSGMASSSCGTSWLRYHVIGCVCLWRCPCAFHIVFEPATHVRCGNHTRTPLGSQQR